MASILDYSTEPRFNIKAVSQKTDIQPVTIRAWERRYRLLNPQRATNGYRLYCERDVAILNWIKKQVDSGISISSAVAEFNDITGQEKWPEAVFTDKGPMPSRRVNEMDRVTVVGQLTQALIRHDERMAAEIFAEAMGAFDLIRLFELVITEVMIEIGDRWERGEITVATEHFASGFIRGKVQAIYQSLPLRSSAPKILVGCAPEELHEIGPLMFATLLRDAGYRVEYLGPDIPLDDLVLYAGSENPRLLILAATLADSAVDLEIFPAKLLKLIQPPLFGFGGAAFIKNPALVERSSGIYLGRNFSQSIITVKQLVQVRSQVRT